MNNDNINDNNMNMEIEYVQVDGKKSKNALIYFVLLLIIALVIGIVLPNISPHNSSSERHFHSFPRRKHTLPDLAVQEGLRRKRDGSHNTTGVRFGVKMIKNSKKSQRNVVKKIVNKIAFKLGQPFIATKMKPIATKGERYQVGDGINITSKSLSGVVMPPVPLPLVSVPSSRHIVYVLSPSNTGCLSSAQSEMLTLADTVLLDHEHNWGICGIDASFLCSKDEYSADISGSLLMMLRASVENWKSIDILIGHAKLNQMDIYTPFMINNKKGPNFMGHHFQVSPKFRIGRLTYDWFDKYNTQISLDKLWDEIWVTSEFAAKELESIGINSNKIWVLPEAVGVFMGQSQHGLDAIKAIDSSWNIRLHQAYNAVIRVSSQDTVTWQTTVEAFVRVFSGYKNVSLTLIMEKGAYSTVDIKHEQKLAELISKYAVSLHISNIPTINIVTRTFSTQELSRLYHLMDVFLYPHPGTPRLESLIQAVASHLPIIATNYGAVEGVFNNDTALLIPTTNSFISNTFPRSKRPDLNAFIELIKHSYNRPTVARNRATRAYSQILPKYARNIVAQSVLTKINNHL